jgi:SAM-dependent methyltransferase
MSLAARTLAPVRDVRLEQAARADWAGRAGERWERPDELIDFLRDATHHLDAAEAFAWDDVLRPGARVLDLGCGSGWLTAMLSARPAVAHVTAMDLSPRLLDEALPAVLDRLGGRAEIVDRICGTFTPLPLEDASLDLIAMSSAFHHSDKPDELLDEMLRVLAPGGVIVLLNETPWSRVQMLNFGVRTTAVALINLFARDRVRRWPGHFASTHAMYDDELGDRVYTLAQWRDLARRHGFGLEVRDSRLYPYKRSFREPSRLQGTLAHIVLRPLAR